MNTKNTTKRIVGVGTLVMTPKDGSSLTLTRAATKRWHNAAGTSVVRDIIDITRTAAREGSGSCGLFDSDGHMLRNVEEP